MYFEPILVHVGPAQLDRDAARPHDGIQAKA
jgi:hypothetical protein